MENQESLDNLNITEPTAHDIVSETVSEFSHDIERLNRKTKRRSAKSYFDTDQPKKKTSKKTAARKAPKAKNRLIQPHNPSKALSSPIEYLSDDTDLPTKYEMTYVHILPRDPFTIYAYWEISSSSIPELEKQFQINMNEATYTLRLYDVTLIDFNGTNANSFHDFDDLYMNSRYISIPHDNTNWCAEIGIRQHNGIFISLCRSNTIHVQAATGSNNTHFNLKEVSIKKFTTTERKRKKNKARIDQEPYTLNNLQYHIAKQTVSAHDMRLFYEQGLSLLDFDKRQFKSRSGQILKNNLTPEELKKLFALNAKNIFYKYKKHFAGSSENLTLEFLGASEGIFYREIKSKDQ